MALREGKTISAFAARRPRHIQFAVVAALIAALTLGIGTPAAGAASTFVQYTYSGAVGSRTYYVYTPVGYTTTQRVPLIVMLHGCGGNAIDFSNTTQMNVLADSRQFIVAYPQQSSTYNGCWVWANTANQVRGSGEAAIIAGITQTVIADAAHWNVDISRVYVVGFSAGAGMAVVMAATYPDLYAAMGESAGYEYKALTNGTVGPYLPSGGPDPVLQGRAAFDAMGSRARVVPVIAFHGTQDSTVPPINGDQVVRQWMETDRLAAGGSYNGSFSAPSATVTGQVPGGRAYTVRSWNDAASNGVEEYWTVTGMVHAWSGGSNTGSYADPSGPSASQSMYTFFMAHPLVVGPPPPLQITSVVAANVGASSAVITWQTNNYADSRVDYGTTTPYSSVSNPSALTTHSLTLTGLTSTTTYHYQVTSVDTYAQSATSADTTFTTTAASTFNLSLSTLANRSAASPLQGKTVSANIFVFVSPESGVSQVRFYLDNPQRTGSPTKTEGVAAWDFAGTAGDGTAIPYSTTVISNAQHSITAAIDKSGGGTDVVTATFTVSNAAPPPPPPSAFSLQMSVSANRSVPAALEGKTVSGTIYVFVGPASGANQVRFYLDNPQRIGAPTRTEGLAAWDFAGTAADGSAYPFGTATLANGQHSITAAVDKSAGGTDVLTATFTVANP